VRVITDAKARVAAAAAGLAMPVQEPFVSARPIEAVPPPIFTKPQKAPGGKFQL